MGKKGNIINIPLQAELCLNKAKVDITEFNGWQKNNAPVYGNCLSPLYKKDSEHHDFFLEENGSEVAYDFTNGTLKRNGVNVLSGSGSKKISKRKLTENYSSLTFTADNKKTWVKETSSSTYSYCLGGGDTKYSTEANINRIIATKTFGNSTKNVYGIAIWYINTLGTKTLAVRYVLNGGDEVFVSSSAFTLETTSPLIQVAIEENNTTHGVDLIISLFADKGSDRSKIGVKSYLVTNAGMLEIDSFQADGLTTITYPSIARDIKWKAKFTATSEYFHSQDTNSAKGTSLININQTLEISLSKTPAQNIQVYILWAGNTSNLDQYSLSDMYTESEWKISANEQNKTINLGSYYYKTVNNGSSVVTTGPTASGKLFTIWDRQTIGEYVIVLTYITDTNPNNKYIEPNFTKNERSYAYMGHGLSFSNQYSEIVLSYNADPRTPNFNNASKPSKMHGYYGSGNFAASNFYTTNNAKAESSDFVAMNNTTTEMSDINIIKKSDGITISPVKECDCVMDDGYLYTIGALTSENTILDESKSIVLAGTYLNYSLVSTTKAKIHYMAVSKIDVAYDQKNNVFPKYYAGMNICLENYYLRIIYNFTANEVKEDETPEYITMLIDSANVVSGLQQNVVLNPGLIQGTSINKQGTCFNTTTSGSGWRLLFNNNLLYGISVYENPNYIGTLVTDWISVDTEWCPAFNNEYLVYKDNTGTLWELHSADTSDWLYKVVEKRYVILNTSNYYNCYDTKTGMKRHWASDYNNRCYYGYGFTDYKNNTTFKNVLSDRARTMLFSTSQNANFERTKDSITSIEFGALIYEGVRLGYFTLVNAATPYGAVEGIDYYDSEYEDSSSTSAQYKKSFLNGYSYIDTNLTDPAATYPISTTGDVRYSPSLFSEFISSYNNKDMVVSDGIAYPLQYFNNTIPVISYFMLNGMEGLENAFVLQTSFYGVSKDRLYQLTYNNGVSAEAVCDITNMEFLGALPTKALFWSAQNRAIYIFGGSCIMQLSQYANDLEYINGKWYNTATQELFLDTNIGLLVFSDLGTYCLNDILDVKDIFFFKDYFIVNNDVTIEEEVTPKTTYFSYNPLEGYTSNKVKFLTKYYGNNNTPVTINNIYIRIYDLDMEEDRKIGKIVLKGYTVTDVGYETDVKTIYIGDQEVTVVDEEGNEVTEEVIGETWDEQTGTILFKYTPQYNRGLGVALEVESDFPIVDIKYDVVDSAPSESQLSHINI